MAEKKSPTIMCIGAHDTDFLSRAGGTIARFVQQGSRAVSISLSYGERQESGRQWKMKGEEASLEDMKKIKEEECVKSAEAIGTELVILDWEDCPITFDRQRYEELATEIRKVRPDIIFTHWPHEIINEDHATTGREMMKSVHIAGAGGALLETGLEPCSVREIYYCEPGFPFPDFSDFKPNVLVDITSTFDAKLEGLKASWSHGHLERSYTFCAEFRGYQMSRFTGDENIKYGEAFVRFYTQMGMDGLDFQGSIQLGEIPRRG